MPKASGRGVSKGVRAGRPVYHANLGDTHVYPTFATRRLDMRTLQAERDLVGERYNQLTSGMSIRPPT